MMTPEGFVVVGGKIVEVLCDVQTQILASRTGTEA